MLKVVMLNVVMLSVIMLNVVARPACTMSRKRHDKMWGCQNNEQKLFWPEMSKNFKN